MSVANTIDRMGTPISEAIDRLYDGFAHYHRPASIVHCEHCLTPGEAQALLAPVPLRQLSMEALKPYAYGVMLTVGDADDFRYFLPRLLEITDPARYPYPDLESMLSRLRFAHWTRWPQAEQDAVRVFLRALWEDALYSLDPVAGAGEALCAITNAEDDIGPYLNEWTTGDPIAARRLREFVSERCTVDPGGRLRPVNAYWKDRDTQVLEWLNTVAAPERTAAAEVDH